MSAYIVDAATIDLVVQGLIHFGITKCDEREATANALLAQNIASVNARYKLTNPMHNHTEALSWVLLHRFTFRNTRQLAALLGACQCYRYQAEETEDWERTPANRWTLALLNAIARRLCEVALQKVPWGISNASEAKDALVGTFD